MRALLVALPNEVLLDILVGAALAVLSYSSLAIVLLTAALASQGMLPSTVAMGLVLGANVGSGVLAMLVTSAGNPQLRRLPLGNFIFKVVGALLVIPFLPQLHAELQNFTGEVHQQVVLFRLAFNAALALAFIGLTGPTARLVERLLPTPAPGTDGDRPKHLDPVALATPSLAISCAAREALHHRKALAFAFANAGIIAAYARGRWPLAILGGAASLGSYAIALWAMARTPVASVAALREASVLFAALLGTWLLNERFGWQRALGTAVVVEGVIGMRLG